MIIIAKFEINIPDYFDDQIMRTYLSDLEESNNMKLINWEEVK